MDTIKNFFIILYFIFRSFFHKKEYPPKVVSFTCSIDDKNRDLDKLLLKTDSGETHQIPVRIFTKKEINRLWDILEKRKISC